MLTWADYAVLALLVLSMAIGLWRGLVVEVLSLTVWVAAFWLAMNFGDDLVRRLDVIDSNAARWFLGYAGVFLGSLLLGGVAIWGIGKLIASTGLSALDRLFGLGFGLLRGYALGCVLVLGLGFTALPQQPGWRESRLLPALVFGADWLRGFLSPAAAEQNSVLVET